MLTGGIAAARRSRTNALASAAHVETHLTTGSVGHTALSNLFRVSLEYWLQSLKLKEEVFGLLRIIIEVAKFYEMVAEDGAIERQLTCNLYME